MFLSALFTLCAYISEQYPVLHTSYNMHTRMVHTRNYQPPNTYLTTSFSLLVYYLFGRISFARRNRFIECFIKRNFGGYDSIYWLTKCRTIQPAWNNMKMQLLQIHSWENNIITKSCQDEKRGFKVETSIV
jgi:hypothetical protein